MRFELYSFVENSGSVHYRFETESDCAEELLLYVVQYSAKRSERKWLYVDNEAPESVFLSLGYSKIPAREECFERIAQCKLMRELYFDSIQEHIYENKALFTERYNACLLAAEEKSNLLCQKIFAKLV